MWYSVYNHRKSSVFFRVSYLTWHTILWYVLDNYFVFAKYYTNLFFFIFFHVLYHNFFLHIILWHLFNILWLYFYILYHDKLFIFFPTYYTMTCLLISTYYTYWLFSLHTIRLLFLLFSTFNTITFFTIF